MSPLIPEVQIKDLIALTCHDQLLPFTDCEVLTQQEFLEHLEQPKVSRCHTQTRHGPWGLCRHEPGPSMIGAFRIARYFEEIGIDPNEAEYLFTLGP